MCRYYKPKSATLGVFWKYLIEFFKYNWKSYLTKKKLHTVHRKITSGIKTNKITGMLKNLLNSEIWETAANTTLK